MRFKYTLALCSLPYYNFRHELHDERLKNAHTCEIITMHIDKSRLLKRTYAQVRNIDSSFVRLCIIIVHNPIHVVISTHLSLWQDQQEGTAYKIGKLKTTQTKYIVTYDFKMYFCLYLFRNGFLSHKNYTWLLQTCETWDLSIDFKSRYDCQLIFSIIMQTLIILWQIKSLVIPLPKILCSCIIMYTNNFQYFVKYFLITSVPHKPLVNLNKVKWHASYIF